ncbi:MAG: hypothetical protein EPN85_03910 [Bacteroidetes bacterium]|nr:MAG: hypothetical protein EPN85_03910 [Bacteroidota bacterium]
MIFVTVTGYCTLKKFMQITPIELIAVFKKEVSMQNAKAILYKSKVKYREGMDSSRGKIYFYKTGAKFVLTFSTISDKEYFISNHKETKEIFELYTPDWRIQKD